MPRGPGRRRPADPRRPSHRAESRTQAQSPGKSGINTFDLFCAYHLGIAPDKSYRAANIHDVARRFGVDAGVIRQTLQEYGMDPETLLETDYDLTMAQMDIQVAPPGVDRVELARGIFEEFEKAPRKQRNWQEILSDDARENARIFGKKS